MLYAFAGAGVIGVTRQEAEALFDINDAVRGRENDPAWTDLFVKAVASSLVCASSYTAPSRETALHREDWLQSRGDIVRGWRRVFGPVDFEAALAPDEFDQAWAERQARVDGETRAAAPVTAAEAGWLVERLNRDGLRDTAEQALLDFLRSEAVSLDAALRPMIERAA